MNEITITRYVDAVHRVELIALWRTVFGYETAHNDPRLVIDKKLAAEDGLVFVALSGSNVIGSVMAGYDGHRGWLYSLAVSPDHRMKKIGSRLVETAEQALTSLGCMKINLQIMEGNEAVQAFYEACGYSKEVRVSMGKRLPENIGSITEQ